MRLTPFFLQASLRGLTRHSVIRPSLVVTFFFVAGQAFFYVLVFAGNRLFDPVAFGRFYAAWAALNVFVTPGSVLAMVLMRYFAQINLASGAPGVVLGLIAVASSTAPWVVSASVICVITLNLGGALIGVDSVVLTILVPLISAAILGVEMIRAAYQGMLRFVWFGASWFGWCVAQSVLGIVGIALIGTVWAAYAGMLVASLLTIVVLMIPLRALARKAPATNKQSLAPTPLNWRAAIPFCTAFGGLVLFNNADIFIAYLTMDVTNLGAYSAAAVLPKAILTATQPIVQTIFPVVIHLHEDAAQPDRAIAKALGLALAVAVAGVAVLWGGVDIVCGGPYGIRFCSPILMTLLAVAAIPLAVIRVWATSDLGRHRYWMPHFPIVAFLFFTTLEGWWHPSSLTLAVAYGSVSWAMLMVTGLVSTAQWYRDRSVRTAAARRQPTA
jgi:O-antigen/teichoic acid export membrane protein